MEDSPEFANQRSSFSILPVDIVKIIKAYSAKPVARVNGCLRLTPFAEKFNIDRSISFSKKDETLEYEIEAENDFKFKPPHGLKDNS